MLFAAETVRGVRTNAVRGDLTPREALDQMLAGTPLVAVPDERSGALAVSRKPAAPAENTPPNRRTATDASDNSEIVKLEEFKVSTTVGTYAETTTSAASKIPLDMKDLAATLQVLNASFIGDKLATSLEDLYPYVVGMTRESPAGAGFTLRGYTNSATNTMINNLTTDGLPGGASRFGSPPTANVERVEVIKGPNSVLYGAMNPGGLINIFAAGVFTGILSGTKMIEAMAQSVVAAVPPSLGPYLAPITGVLSLPFTFFISNDAFYYGVVPVLAQAASAYGISAAEIGRASLVEQPVHLLSPLVPSTYLLVALCGVELGDHQRFTLKWTIVTAFVLLAVGLLTAVIPLTGRTG